MTNRLILNCKFDIYLRRAVQNGSKIVQDETTVLEMGSMSGQLNTACVHTMYLQKLEKSRCLKRHALRNELRK